MQLETQVIITKNAIIRIHHPDLTDEERAKRMKAIEQAAIRLARANHQVEAQRKRRAEEAAVAAEFPNV